MTDREDQIESLDKFPTIVKVHTQYPNMEISRAATLAFENRNDIATFMIEASRWVEIYGVYPIETNPPLAVTIHVSYWLARLNDQPRIEKWTQTVEGIGQYISEWQAINSM